MAKIRENTRKVAAANKATTRKAKTTTPVKTMNGKIHKVRVNVKNMKKSVKSKEEISKTNSIECNDQTVSPKTRLCFVKLRRTLANDTSSSSSYNNINNNNKNTLQAQCKVNEKNQNNIELKSPQLNGSTEKTKKAGRPRKNAIKIINNASIPEKNENFDGKTLDAAAEIRDNIAFNINSSTNNSPRRCFVKLKRTAKLINKKQNKQQLPEAEGLKSQRNKRSALETNGLEPITPKSIKNCVVKLKNTPSITKTKEVNEEPSTPHSAKSCVVRLKRTPIVEKPNDFVIEPKSPNTTRACVVRLPKTPILLGNKENTECTEPVTPNYQSPIPVNKRNNFHKLSLTKSLRKSLENKEIETILNSKHNDNKETNKLESEIINNNTETNNNSVNRLKPQNCIKHFAKLSLRRTNQQPNKNLTTNLEVTQFEPQQNSTICFEPARNSTLLEFGFTKDKNKVKPKQLSKDKSSSQNLANKSEEIVDLLNSLDEDDELLLKSPEKPNNEREPEKIVEKVIEKGIETTQNSKSPAKSHTHKFFHRHKEDAAENMTKAFTEPKAKSPAKAANGKRRRILAKRSTAAKRDNIYEFLSQSQTSDSDGTTKNTDPTADIIKKLIDQGKVRVATNCKGKGKPIFKRKAPPPKQMKKIKPTVDKKPKNTRNNIKKAAEIEKPAPIIDDEVDVIHMDDDFDNYEPLLPDNEDNMENQRTTTVNKALNQNNNRHHVNDHEGTFSRLARSVLINEAGRSDLQRKNASLLLEMVKKFVSTPKNKQMPSPQAALESELSPIPIPPLRPATKPSPWRVDEDAYLPKTFNFARSSGNLPSFSSDFIPSTPRKEKPKIQTTTVSNNYSPIIGNQNKTVSNVTPLQSPLHNNVENIQAQTANENVPAQIPNQNENSVLSSFSSNDSNAENMPPPRPLQDNCNENENIFALKQLPNPRRALNYRSPLKAINILEVVHLPPYKSANKTPNSKEPITESIEMFGFEENLNDDSLQVDKTVASVNTSPQADINTKTKNHPKEDLFGFEDFLSQTEYSSQENDETNNNETTNNNQNLTIQDKLQDLRKLKPAENDLALSILKESKRNPLKTIPLFDEEAASKADGFRQRGIKEMLCSTLINPQPSTSKEALKHLNKSNWKHSKRPNFGEELDLSELFKDPEPETTFNENDAHRTYVRPYKRKRRLKQNKYVMFLDSDESDDEHNSAEQQKHQRSHETDTSSEQAPRKKRQRKEPKEKPELAEFVEEFNEMCKEVDSYELIVEKSA
ncbi:MATH and LRR domain-containing protein PFE0570w [Lucilia cuprina]|uniref:MATH and LRR domain-containing protein PFE0570w n=1 Tax=Lucilia cuprina TaxID=7375 RepID=UPI001F0621CB|nr:MATH and LRR domain-containing protein PFE0570w [Lucilia cuprina]